jgi:hypothetical protein
MTLLAVVLGYLDTEGIATLRFAPFAMTLLVEE